MQMKLMIKFAAFASLSLKYSDLRLPAPIHSVLTAFLAITAKKIKKGLTVLCAGKTSLLFSRLLTKKNPWKKFSK
jgi:hypothetical protein